MDRAGVRMGERKRLALVAHDVDVKALLRIAVVYNIPTACNRATADFIVSSALMGGEYERRLRDLGRRDAAE